MSRMMMEVLDNPGPPHPDSPYQAESYTRCHPPAGCFLDFLPVRGDAGRRATRMTGNEAKAGTCSVPSSSEARLKTQTAQNETNAPLYPDRLLANDQLAIVRAPFIR